MSTNVSKQKREDLLAKIKAIRTYIATAPQDENTANLLAYLSELEKDVGAKKYGLVFEEHREEIDEVLATHTPVLTEDGSLFIDNGGQMNFLIEGDNLASLQLLEKTHKGKIDLTKRLRSLMGDNVFQNPKDEEIIKNIIDFSALNTSIVLDFFAGSGTTGHAVMKLNAEDGGTRRFILCTNNENNICREVTYERIKRVIDKEGYAASLKYFKVDYIPVSEHMYYEYANELLAHIRELVELENGINFTGNAEIGIVLTEEELDEFVANIEDFSKCKKLYMGHDLLPDEEQEQSISSHEIEVNIIPDYYYKDLQEN